MADKTLQIDFPREAVDDLHRRLDEIRWPETGFDAGWDRGMDQVTLRELVRYWRHDYDWFAAQSDLNRLEHRTVEIDGENLHYVTYHSERPDPKPILVLHGWPGSFVEFLDSAVLLCDAGYEVIVPSLPGFALSDPPRKPGMHGGRIAERLHELMRRLGHERYGVQGGDWGAVIALALAHRQPEAVTGLHLNLIPGAPPPPEGEEPGDEERAWREWRERFNEHELAYYDVQATKPDTLAYALADSPVGLLAWIVEKLWAWSDHGGDLWSSFDRDRTLTNVMLYWLPNRVQSSARIYYEMENPDGPIFGRRTEVPTGYLRMPKEPWGPPRAVAERMANVVHYTEAPRGGHFAAMEEPRIWADDVAAFFGGRS